MFEKFTKRAMENAKRTLKEEVVQCVDDLLPTVVGIASITLLIFANIPPQKHVAQQLIINNFYIGR